MSDEARRTFFDPGLERLNPVVGLQQADMTFGLDGAAAASRATSRPE